MNVSTSEQKTKRRPRNTRVCEIQDSYKELEFELEEIVSNCEHQFVPAEGSLEKLRKTKVEGVYYGGETDEIRDDINGTQFSLECLECCIRMKTNIACHCPGCGHTTEGSWGKPEDLQLHLGGGDYVYNDAWWILCTNCGFKAISQRWDQ